MSSQFIIGVGFSIFIFALFKVFQPIRARKKAAKQAAAIAKQHPGVKLVVTSSDISAIAGDDVIATQLDLARAYIETGRYILAKKILDHARDHGNKIQQKEAYLLLKHI